MLKELSKNIPLGVVSARDEASSLAFINQFNLGPYFQTVVTSQTCRRTKPFPDPLLCAAGQLDIAAENCLMVGDTTVDIRAANLAGMQSLGVLCGFGTERELIRAGATQILNSPVELIQLFKDHLSKNDL
jgi:phosphoglycolate phosphatase-like HAD superfamily hydrolase